MPTDCGLYLKYYSEHLFSYILGIEPNMLFQEIFFQYMRPTLTTTEKTIQILNSLFLVAGAFPSGI
jgi:hypothetical protein